MRSLFCFSEISRSYYLFIYAYRRVIKTMFNRGYAYLTKRKKILLLKSSCKRHLILIYTVRYLKPIKITTELKLKRN